MESHLQETVRGRRQRLRAALAGARKVTLRQKPLPLGPRLHQVHVLHCQLGAGPDVPQRPDLVDSACSKQEVCRSCDRLEDSDAISSEPCMEPPGIGGTVMYGNVSLSA